MIRFHANSKQYDKTSPLSISEFIKELNLPPETIIVEYNKEFLQRSCFEDTIIKNGDNLEIVRAFAGG